MCAVCVSAPIKISLGQFMSSNAVNSEQISPWVAGPSCWGPLINGESNSRPKNKGNGARIANLCSALTFNKAHIFAAIDGGESGARHLHIISSTQHNFQLPRAFSTKLSCRPCLSHHYGLRLPARQISRVLFVSLIQCPWKIFSFFRLTLHQLRKLAVVLESSTRRGQAAHSSDNSVELY